MKIAGSVIVALIWLSLTWSNFVGMGSTAGQAAQVHGTQTGGHIAWGMFAVWELIFTAIAVLLLVWLW